MSTWVRVVERGSFTAAARDLGLPKSSVSRAVAQLEHELGVSLLQRTTRKLTLTAAGERYLASAREALRTLEEARAELANDGAAVRGSVRLTAPNPNASRLGSVLVQAVASFLERYPEVFIDLMFTGRRVDLAAERVDFAIRAGKLDDSSLIARRIKSEHLVLVASPAYLARHGTPGRLADLAQHHVILNKAPNGSGLVRMSGPKGSERVSVRGPVSVEDASSALPLAEAGVGIAQLPWLVAYDSLQARRTLRVLPAYAQRNSAIYLVYPPQRHVPKRVVLLRDHVYQTLMRELSDCKASR